MKYLYLFTFILFYSCSDGTSLVNDGDNIPQDLSSWYVSEDDIGGGISNFPVMDNPQYSSVPEIEALNVLSDNSRLALLKVDQQVFAFPNDFTSHFEVVNGTFNNRHLAITYCPLTLSGLCFDRELSSNDIVTLKASGYLYNNNLIPTDINLTRYWSQMSTKVIRGDDSVLRLSTYNMIETTWLMVKNYFPQALVFKHDDINVCSACNPPNTPINFDKLFGVVNEHVFSDTVHLYNYDNFTNGTNIEYLAVNSKSTIVVGNKEKILFNAFYVPSNISFNVLNESEFPLILGDNEGNKWDVFGYATQGPRFGQTLNSPKSYQAAPNSWNDLFETITIHD